MRQRTRTLAPLLPALTAIAERRHHDCTGVSTTPPNRRRWANRFDVAGIGYERIARGPTTATATADPPCADSATMRSSQPDPREDEAFWAWAIVETLRHTGVRIEELLELTHLALVSHRLPDTGEIVPLLQIVPSKTTRNGCCWSAPELARVLARSSPGSATGTAAHPAGARYDNTNAPPDRRCRTCSNARSAAPRGHQPQHHPDSCSHEPGRAGLRDAAGDPCAITPHDFRRIFATEAVPAGLPCTSPPSARPPDLNTTQAYIAVFQDDLIRTYRAFSTRRAARPGEEYREPTDDEWREFEQHFTLRKVELGTCARPYGTPCKHEHACIRCPMLRVDPARRADSKRATTSPNGSTKPVT